MAQHRGLDPAVKVTSGSTPALLRNTLLPCLESVEWWQALTHWHHVATSGQFAGVVGEREHWVRLGSKALPPMLNVPHGMFAIPVPMVHS